MQNVFIKPESTQEKEFCKRHKLQFKRLDNGITILGIPHRMDSAAWAEVKWSFPQGAWHNIPGSVHFLEHFINQNTRLLAERNSLRITASTSQTEITETVSGVANTKALEYGIWPILEKIKTALESPLDTVPSPQKTIASERNVIKAEIKRTETEQDFQAGNYFRKIVYAQQNPLLDNPTITGSEKDLDKITERVLRQTQTKIFIPDQLMISFLTEGNASIASILAKKLERLFQNFPRENIKAKKAQFSNLEKISPNFTPDKTYSFKTTLKNEIISTLYIWMFKNTFPSSQYFAARLLKNALSTNLFLHARKKGWGYYTDVSLVEPTLNLFFLLLRIDAKKDNFGNYKSDIKKVIENTNKDIGKNCDDEKRRQIATPISIKSRFSWIEHGLKDYNAMIDIDKIRPLMKVSNKEMESLINQIVATKPVEIIVGDLD